MGLARPIFPGGSDNRGGRELRDGDVVGMSVGAFGTERDDYVWLHSTDVFRYFCHRLSDVHPI